MLEGLSKIAQAGSEPGFYRFSLIFSLNAVLYTTATAIAPLI